MGDMGFLGLSLPEEYGGSNLDFFSYFKRGIRRLNSGGFLSCNKLYNICQPHIFLNTVWTIKQNICLELFLMI